MTRDITQHPRDTDRQSPTGEKRRIVTKPARLADPLQSSESAPLEATSRHLVPSPIPIPHGRRREVIKHPLRASKKVVVRESALTSKASLSSNGGEEAGKPGIF